MSDDPEQSTMGSQGFGQIGQAASNMTAYEWAIANAHQGANAVPAPEPAAPAHHDVTGQLGGPHPDEQARVDEEQRQLMARNAAIRAAAEKAEGANYEGKLKRFEAAMQKRADLEQTVADLVAANKALTERVGKLEAK